MGEALISRATVIPEELLDPIYPVAGACVLSVKIVDSLNNPIENVPVTCKDGSYSYTYNTNNKGMTRFTTNSGQPSIFLNNNLSNSARILDHSSYWYNNIEGPIGSVVNKTFNMPYLSGLSISGGIGSGTEINKNIFYGIFLATNYVSGNLRGGGGGGGGGIGAWLYSQHGNEIGGANGGNGGRGNQVIFNNIPVVKVRPLLNAEDITKLKRFNLKEKKGRYLLSEIYGEIEKSCEIKDKNSLIKSLKQLLGTRLIDDFLSKKITIFDTISKSFISLNQKAENWEEAIKIAGSILLKNNCIEKSYIENMIECVRNYGSYMVVDENIAFPHAKSEGDVKKTAFAIVTLENEVLFPENVPIKTIIAFSSVDNKEHLDMFLELMEMIEKKEFKVENFVKKF